MSEEVKIITICGSMSLTREMIREREKLILNGCIVLTPEYVFTKTFEKIDDIMIQKLENLHKFKIDMSDEILVVYRNKRIGNSTQKEIEFAKLNNKIINYVEV